MVGEILKKLEKDMEKTISDLKIKLGKVRTGRASASLLDEVKANYYGALTPLRQMANITVPEPRLIIIQPYDPNSIKEIEKAIISSDLGLNPHNDGRVVRVPIPELTEERRGEMVKLVKKIAEEHRVAIRQERKQAIEELKKLEKDKKISEDDLHREMDKVQKKVDEVIKKIDELASLKEKEILEE